MGLPSPKQILPQPEIQKYDFAGFLVAVLQLGRAEVHIADADNLPSGLFKWLVDGSSGQKGPVASEENSDDHNSCIVAVQFVYLQVFNLCGWKFE